LQLKFRYKHFQFYVPIFRLLSVKFQSNFWLQFPIKLMRLRAQMA
jgi:hypothetical protein